MKDNTDSLKLKDVQSEVRIQHDAIKSRIPSGKIHIWVKFYEKKNKQVTF